MSNRPDKALVRLAGTSCPNALEGTIQLSLTGRGETHFRLKPQLKREYDDRR